MNQNFQDNLISLIFEFKRNIVSFTKGFIALFKEKYPYLKGSIKLTLTPYKKLTTFETFGFISDYNKWGSNSFEESINNNVLITGKSEHIANISMSPLAESLKYVYKNEKIYSLLAIPINSPWGTIGVLNLYGQTLETFSKYLILSLEKNMQLFGTIAYLLWEYQDENQKNIILLRELDRQKELNDFYSMIVENVPVGIVATDKRGYVMFVNAELERISKQKKENVLGKKWYDAFGFYGDTRKRLENTYWSRKTNYFPEIYLGLIDGGISPVEMKTTPIKSDKNGNDIVGVVAICSDLSQKKILEKEVERIDRFSGLGRIATGLAHEIRNPLAGIKGVLQILEENISIPKDKRLVSKIHREIDRLNCILENLLSSVSMNISIEEVKIEDICEDVLLLINSFLKSNKIRLIKKYGKGLPYANVDKASFKQVILNILLNAINALPEGGEIILKTFLIEDLTKMSNKIYWHESYILQLKEHKKFSFLCVAIEDNGIGIDATDIPKIFTPYFSISPGGSGLGLFLSSQIMIKHQGIIGVESVYGKGTKFYVLLPLS